MSHKCPSCGSEQTASIKVAQARETQTGKFGGLGIDTGGDVGIFGGTTTSTSAFGRSLSAPGDVGEQRSTSGPLIMATLAGVVAMFAGLRFAYAKRGEGSGSGVVMTICIIVFIGGIVWSIVNARFNTSSRIAMASINAKRHLAWARSWVCYQCGFKFEPQEVSAEPARMKVPPRPEALASRRSR